MAPKFGGQALFSRFTLNTQNTLSSTEPTITTIDALGARDIAFESENDMLPVCYGHIWPIRKSLITKKDGKFIFFFQFYTQKKKRLFCKMYIDATPATIDFCDSAFERRIMCFRFAKTIFCFYVCRLLQKMWKVFVFFQFRPKRQKKCYLQKKTLDQC